MYVDDFPTRGESINEVKKLKSDSTTPFRQRDFKLYKWHSNEKILKANDTKILGILWDKRSVSFIIEISNFSRRLTKRNIL